MQKIKIGNLNSSKFMLGGNPFSGFSHLGSDMDEKMVDYYTVENIKKELEKAEKLGITTLIARGDRHIKRVLHEYWNEGGNIKWIAQSCPELVSLKRSIMEAVNGGASACYIHGGQMDNLFANNKLEVIPAAIKMIKEKGLPAGVAGHMPEVHLWAEENLDVDFHMCSYYNPSNREKIPDHRPDAEEYYGNEDRERMIKTIQKISKPVIHYKILAAGRNVPEEAFKVAGKAIRPEDAVCVGVFAGKDQKMLKKDVNLYQKYIEEKGVVK